MNELQKVFEYQDKQIRTVVKDDEPWFVAKDVCDALEIDSTQTRRLDEDEKGLCLIQTPGGPQEMLVVNEPGLYSLILGSRKPEAKQFKRWVTHEVLPSIRKTGQYVVPTLTPTEALLQAVTILDQHAKQLKRLEAAQAESSQRLEILNHRVDSLDAVNVVGDPRQRLNRMVQKYARQKGILFNVAWHDFKQAFNTAYRTNLELLILNFERKTGMKKVTIPQYLAATGKLEDGIRVADKLLNQAQAS